MEFNDKFLNKINDMLKAEFKRENKELLLSQKGKWFKSKYEYNSFVAGFSCGMDFMEKISKEGYGLEDDK